MTTGPADGRLTVSAFEEGKKAYAEGLRQFENPYHGIDVAKYSQWSEGWNEGRGDRCVE